MAVGDEIQNNAHEGSGKAKESLGDGTGNESLQAEGAKDQAAAHTKQAAKDVKDDLTD